MITTILISMTWVVLVLVVVRIHDEQEGKPIPLTDDHCPFDRNDVALVARKSRF
jgi:hypothetical protein